MYFWKLDALKEQIKSQNLTEKDRFTYALVYVVLGAVEMQLSILWPPEIVNVWDWVHGMAYVLITAMGSIFVFQANGGNEGQDYLGRYVSIGFVMSVRFLIYAIPMFVCLLVYYVYAYGDDDVIPSSAYDTLPFIVWYAALYWRIGVHVKDLNRH